MINGRSLKVLWDFVGAPECGSQEPGARVSHSLITMSAVGAGMADLRVVRMK